MSAGPRILIFGEQGQVAWELARALSTLGQVVCAGRTSTTHSVDLASPDSVCSLIGDLKPQWIVNAAAYTAVDKAEEEEELAMKINGLAPGVIAEQAARLDACLVHYSTDYVFDGEAETPYQETSATNPQSVYGRTKLAGERAVEAVDGDYFIFRTSWVYGARGHNFFRTMLRLMAEREELGVVSDQLGSPTWCRNIAEATGQLISKINGDRDTQREHSGIYHMTSAGMTSWYGFASAILDGLRARKLDARAQLIKPIRTEDYPLPAKRPDYSVLDNSKLQDAFQLYMPDWRDALNQVQDEVAG